MKKEKHMLVEDDIIARDSLNYKKKFKDLIKNKIKDVNKQIKKINEENRDEFGYVVFGKYNEDALYDLLKLEGKNLMLMELKKELE